MTPISAVCRFVSGTLHIQRTERVVHCRWRLELGDHDLRKCCAGQLLLPPSWWSSLDRWSQATLSVHQQGQDSDWLDVWQSLRVHVCTAKELWAMTTETGVQLGELSMFWCTVNICEQCPQCCCLALASTRDCVPLPSYVQLQGVLCGIPSGLVVAR